MSTISGLSLGSQSTSRRRRPGAAKTRLERAREAEKKKVASHHVHKNGWHDSILAAVESTNRAWEPQNGWENYKDRKEEVETGDQIVTLSPSEKLHIPLHIAASKPLDNHNEGISGMPSVAIANGGAPHHDEERHSVSRKESKSKISQTTTTQIKPSMGNAHDKKTSKAPKATRANNKSITTRESLVHSKPTIISKPRERSSGNLSDDPCWPHSPRRRGSDARPLLGHKTSPKSRQRTRSDNKFKVSRAVPKNPPVPPKIERVVELQPTAEGSRRRKVHSLSPTRQSGRRQSASAPVAVVNNNSEDKSQGGRWVQSMRRAAAPLAKDGHIWDPKHGFTNLDSMDVVSLQPSVRSSPPATGSHQRQQQQQQRQLQQAVRLTKSSSSPADVLDKIISERRRNDPPGRKEAATSDSLRASVANRFLYKEENNEPSPVQQGQGKLGTNGIEEDQSTIEEQIEVVMVSNATTGGGGGDNYGIAALNFEEDEDYLLRAPVVVTPNVTVKKERVSQDEFGLFPSARRSSAQYREQVSPPHVKASSSGTRHSIVRGRSGRSSGPVDVDDVDNLSCASSEPTTDASNVWESGMFENDSFLQGSISLSPSRKRSVSPQRKGYQTKPSLHEDRLAQIGGQDRLENRTASRSNNNNQYASFRELMARSQSRQDTHKDSMPEGSPFNLTKKSSSYSPGKVGRGKPGILKANPRQIPMEIATDDASATSSVTAGWKSFLNKKVKKESAVAAVLQEQEDHLDVKRDAPNDREEKALNKDEKIKKTVSFASDSIISDSHSLPHDSIFDFSMSDVNPPGSPIRSPVTSRKTPLSPKSHRRTDALPKLSTPQKQGQHLSNNRSTLHMSTRGRYSEEEKEAFGNRETPTNLHQRPLSNVDMRPGVSFDLPPHRIRERSFGETTDVSPLTTPHNEEKESYVQGEESQPSFLQRLAECRAPVSRQIQPGAGGPRHQQWRDDGKEPPLAYQWYVQSEQKVEEMMEFLKSKKFSSCSSVRRTNGANLQPSGDGDKGSDKEKSAQDLARARVEAMMETLYYAGRNGARNSYE